MGEEEELGTYPVLMAVIFIVCLLALIILYVITAQYIKLPMFP